MNRDSLVQVFGALILVATVVVTIFAILHLITA